ncbi:MAG: hypothetical protein AB7F64_07835 [Gammaproteobacteria bacterium]
MRFKYDHKLMTELTLRWKETTVTDKKNNITFEEIEPNKVRIYVCAPLAIIGKPSFFADPKFFQEHAIPALQNAETVFICKTLASAQKINGASPATFGIYELVVPKDWLSTNEQKKISFSSEAVLTPQHIINLYLFDQKTRKTTLISNSKSTASALSKPYNNKI